MNLTLLRERIWPRVHVTRARCWVWTGATSRGHGHIKVDGRVRKVHRVVYELLVGPIPEGHDLDHYVCQNKACCNPGHVEPVTPGENVRRANILRARLRRALAVAS